jgi:hypothetical protein
LVLSPLAILYVGASLVIPADAESVRSWRQHYFNIRVRFFALNLAYLVTNFLNTTVLLGQPIIHRRSILAAVLAGLFSVGVLSPRPQLHTAIVLVFTACNLVAAVLALRPGSFGTSP